MKRRPPVSKFVITGLSLSLVIQPLLFSPPAFAGNGPLCAAETMTEKRARTKEEIKEIRENALRGILKGEKTVYETAFADIIMSEILTKKTGSAKTAFLAIGNAKSKPEADREMIREIQDLVEGLIRSGHTVIYDADSGFASIIREAAGQKGMGVSGQFSGVKTHEVNGATVNEIGIENFYRRANDILSTSVVVTTPDSVVGRGLVIAENKEKTRPSTIRILDRKGTWRPGLSEWAEDTFAPRAMRDLYGMRPARVAKPAASAVNPEPAPKSGGLFGSRFGGFGKMVDGILGTGSKSAAEDVVVEAPREPVENLGINYTADKEPTAYTSVNKLIFELERSAIAIPGMNIVTPVEAITKKTLEDHLDRIEDQELLWKHDWSENFARQIEKREKFEENGTMVAIPGGVVMFGSARGSEMFQPAVQGVARGFAKLGFSVTTGGSEGHMKDANQGAKEAGGFSIGVPAETREREVPKEVMNVLINTPDLETRIPVMTHNSRVVAILPGGKGTAEELGMALVKAGAKSSDETDFIFVGKNYYEGLAEWIMESDLPVRVHVVNSEAEAVTLGQKILDENPSLRDSMITDHRFAVPENQDGSGN